MSKIDFNDKNGNQNETINEKDLKEISHEKSINNENNDNIVTAPIIITTTTTITTTTIQTTITNNHSYNNNNCSSSVDSGIKLQRIHSVVTPEQLNEFKRRAHEAVKLNKIFLIRGCFQSVRNALRSRGWVEKIEQHHNNHPHQHQYQYQYQYQFQQHHQQQQQQQQQQQEQQQQQQQQHRKQSANNQVHVVTMDWSMALPKRKTGETRRQFLMKCERTIMSRFIEHLPIDLLWIDRKEKCDYLEQTRNPHMLINKFNRTPFTNKESLNSFLRDSIWFYDNEIADVNFPRCFNVWAMEELNEFIEHFRLTACIGFLRWLIDKYASRGSEFIFSKKNGKIPFSAIEFAMKRCQDFIDTSKHLDIDSNDLPVKSWEHDWDIFLQQHQQFIHEEQTIEMDSHQSPETIICNISKLLDNLRCHWPQYTIDGYCNLWIVKPANKCRGRGIHLGNNLKKILSIVNPSAMAKCRFVIQKYIERPLIIHHTKFDIRQWFLISNIQPLMIWMYKECYLRFSSQEYTLKNYHESVHLTNHAIQKKYTNQNKRDKRLPSENMWDSYTFQAYLRQMGKHHLWWERIYSGMRKAIIATMLASQDYLERNSNTFELFGADFMICENFYPWLIEINSNPDLAPTTSVTARMCPQCLEDVIKVVIDRRHDSKADVGNFELIYRQIVPPTPAYMGLNLCLKGKQLTNRQHNSYHHMAHYYKQQRKERSLQSSHLYRQRLNLTVSSLSHIHKPMPAFNATDYIEQLLVQNRSINSNSTPNLSTDNTKAHSPRQQQKLEQQQQQQQQEEQQSNDLIKSRKSITQMTSLVQDNKSMQSISEISTISPLKANSDTIKSTNLVNSLKRHRSCGPRLTTKTTITVNGNATIPQSPPKSSNKLKLFVGNCQQKKSSTTKINGHYNKTMLMQRSKNSTNLRPSLLTISKSADSIKELQIKMKNSDKCQYLQTKKNSKNIRKFPSTPTPILHSNVNNIFGNNLKLKQNLNIHAVGKSIAKWNKCKEQTSNNQQIIVSTILLSPRYNLGIQSVPLTPNFNELTSNSKKLIT